MTGQYASPSPRANPDRNNPNAIIAGFWGDLYPTDDPRRRWHGDVYYGYAGRAGQRQFIVQFNHVDHYPSGNPVDFQIVLFEGTNRFEIRCLDCRTNGRNHAIGFENHDGSIGLPINYSTALLQRRRFIGIPPPIRVDGRGPYRGNEGGSVTLSGSCIPTCTSVRDYTFGWDFDRDGRFDANGVTVTTPLTNTERTQNRRKRLKAEKEAKENGPIRN